MVELDLTTPCPPPALHLATWTRLVTSSCADTSFITIKTCIESLILKERVLLKIFNLNPVMRKWLAWMLLKCQWHHREGKEKEGGEEDGWEKERAVGTVLGTWCLNITHRLRLYPKHKKQDHKQHYWETEEILVWTMLGNNVVIPWVWFIYCEHIEYVFILKWCSINVFGGVKCHDTENCHQIVQEKNSSINEKKEMWQKG